MNGVGENISIKNHAADGPDSRIATPTGRTTDAARTHV